MSLNAYCKCLLTGILIAIASTSFGQVRAKAANEILLEMRKFNVLGKVLYIAAHPDDENTRLISYLSKDRLYETAYLSLTRGDGGQNLVGTELGEAIGVLRTQELLQARQLDGGQQFFSRAVDFGFSKSAEETFRFWNKEAVLSDVVWIIRKFQPDVIITRFPPDARAGHGHHTASALLAQEAFKISAQKEAFPKHFAEGLQPWQAKSLYWNTGTFWQKDLDSLLQKNDGSVLKLNVGTYNPLLGKSMTEIAAEARSMHKSQGFGSALSRGDQWEYLQWMAGDKVRQDLMEGVENSWQRVPALASMDDKMNEIIKNFDPQAPDKSLPALVALHRLLEKSETTWVAQKREDLTKIIFHCAGIYAEAIAQDYSLAQGEAIQVKLNLIHRSQSPLVLDKIILPQRDSLLRQALNPNTNYTYSYTLADKALPYSQPYWLAKPYRHLYQSEASYLAIPDNKASISLTLRLLLYGQGFDLEVPLSYKRTDRIAGEQFRPFVVLPAAGIRIENEVVVFADKQAKEIQVSVEAYQAGLQGRVRLALPSAWRVEPAEIPFQMKYKNQFQKFTFKVYPPAQAQSDTLRAEVLCQGQVLGQSVQWVEYPHISPQVLLKEARAKVIRLDLKKKSKRIAYVPGAGDEVGEALRQMGYQLTVLPAEAIAGTKLSDFDAIVVGIRAYNTEKALLSANEYLLRYVAEGGRLLVQYNTSMDMLLKDIAPYPIKFGRGRITEENAPARLLNPRHPLWQGPNRITEADFEGWVQERGLYFAESWDKAFEPMLSWQDQGEAPQEGGLLVATHGKGKYIFTGISFFRQLPAGVPGAYRLMANLLDL